jgi:hypothetical protein
MGGPGGRFLCIMAVTDNSTDPSRRRATQHMFAVPDQLEPYSRDWVRWVYARLLDAERHEAAEFFRVDGAAPFYPYHQDEGSPYEHVERW